MTTRRLVLVGAAGAVLAVAAFVAASSHTCFGAWFRWGVHVEQCPAGEVQPVIDVAVESLRRGHPGRVVVHARMMYVVGDSASVLSAPVDVKSVQLRLVGDLHRKDLGKAAGNAPIPLRLDREGAPEIPHALTGAVTLPADLGDGDYELEVLASTAAGSASAQLALPVYAPARIHVMTDRPLYEPGHTIQFRAVVLRARDLVPLDGRPGRFVVKDPSGTTVLDEKSDAGEFGVAAGELPLDKSSPEGEWHVRYESGGASDDVVVSVKPFELPRFTVDVAPAKPFYAPKAQPRLRVHVAYASGVPTRASLEIQWRLTGAWPPPPEWVAAFPKEAKTDAGGNAELALPAVPADLLKKVRVTATVTARDDTGDRQVGQGTLLLSHDAIDVDVVSELGDNGELVAGVNNRAYLRATTVAGAPLDKVSLVVKRAWDPADKGTTVDTDEDGVAAIQLDPGPAVNVLIPPMPVRLPPPPPVVQRTSLTESVRGDATLAEIAAVDRWNPLVASCARFAQSAGASTSVQARVLPSGAVSRVRASGTAGPCVEQALRGRSVPPGGARIFRLTYAFTPSLAGLRPEQAGDDTLPDGLRAELDSAVLDARSCLGRMTTAARLPRLLVWQLDGRRFFADFEKDAGDVQQPLDDKRAFCVEQKLATFARPRTLGAGAGADEDTGDDAGSGAPRFGALRFFVEPVALPGGPARAVATTMLGYELKVTARAGDELVGDTVVRLRPGAVPRIRLRASEVIAAPGDVVTVQIIRGPGFSGTLPKKLVLESPGARLEEPVDDKTRSARFTLPKDKDGWYEARFDAGVARVFVPRQETLLVDVTPQKRVLRPGEKAELDISTRDQKGGVKAAVGLFGVDATLGQLAPLPGVDAMDRLATAVQMRHDAFGVLDATALSLGHIRGKNAAAATVLLVQSTPAPADIDATVSARGSTSFDPLLPLADRFYRVLDALYKQTRTFEKTAPKDEKLTPDKMLGLWDKAVADAAKKGAVTDAFGRRLALAVLPDNLIALTDPRLIVADGTRLPEDVEAWVPFVHRSSR